MIWYVLIRIFTKLGKMKVFESKKNFFYMKKHYSETS